MTTYRARNGALAACPAAGVLLVFLEPGTGLLGWTAATAVLLGLSTWCRASAESQRRRTLVELVRAAPEGTEIGQKAGFGGPEMHLVIGERGRQ